MGGVSRFGLQFDRTGQHWFHGDVILSLAIGGLPRKSCRRAMPGEVLDHLIGASIRSRIAIGRNAGRKALTLRTVPAQAEPVASTSSCSLSMEPKNRFDSVRSRAAKIKWDSYHLLFKNCRHWAQRAAYHCPFLFVH